MGLISSILGNASEADSERIEKDLQALLAEDEQVERAFKVFRDLFVFTNKRLMLVDKQGLTGKKQEYVSIPYKSICYFSLESAGHFDLDAELKIWIGSHPVPITKEFKKGGNIAEISRLLAHYTCR